MAKNNYFSDSRNVDSSKAKVQSKQQVVEAWLLHISSSTIRYSIIKIMVRAITMGRLTEKSFRGRNMLVGFPFSVEGKLLLADNPKFRYEYQMTHLQIQQIEKI